jgi:membrane protein YqaA with SNARE-associated domain
MRAPLPLVIVLVAIAKGLRYIVIAGAVGLF